MKEKIKWLVKEHKEELAFVATSIGMIAGGMLIGYSLCNKRNNAWRSIPCKAGLNIKKRDGQVGIDLYRLNRETDEVIKSICSNWDTKTSIAIAQDIIKAVADLDDSTIVMRGDPDYELREILPKVTIIPQI